MNIPSAISNVSKNKSSNLTKAKESCRRKSYQKSQCTCFYSVHCDRFIALCAFLMTGVFHFAIIVVRRLLLFIKWFSVCVIAVTESSQDLSPLSTRPAEQQTWEKTLTISMAEVITKPPLIKSKVLNKLTLKGRLYTPYWVVLVQAHTCSTSLHPGVQIRTGKFNAGSNPAMD